MKIIVFVLYFFINAVSTDISSTAAVSTVIPSPATVSTVIPSPFTALTSDAPTSLATQIDTTSEAPSPAPSTQPSNQVTTFLAATSAPSLSVITSVLPSASASKGGSSNGLGIGVIEQTPFAYIKTDSSLKGNDRYGGFLIDLYNKMVEQNADLAGTFQPVTNNKYGQEINGSWIGLVGELTGNLDVGLAPLTMTQSRLKVIKFSTTIMKSDLTVMANRKDVFPSVFDLYNLTYFMAPFSAGTWAIIGLSYLMVCILYTLMYFFHPFETYKLIDRGVIKEQQEKTHDVIFKCFWTVLCVIMLQGHYKPKQAYATKVLMAFWFGFSLITIATYFALLIHIAAGHPSEAQVRSLADIVNNPNIKLGCFGGGSTYSFLKDSNEKVLNNAFKKVDADPTNYVKNMQEAYEKVQEGGYAFIGESAMIDYMLSKDCNMVKVGEVLSSAHYAFGLQKLSAGVGPGDKVDAALATLLRNGEVDRLYKKYWVPNKCKTQQVDIHKSPSSGELGNHDPVKIPMESKIFGGPFMFLIIGILLSIIVTVIEIVYYHIKNKKPYGPGPKSGKKPLKDNEDLPEEPLAIPLPETPNDKLV